MEIEPIYQGDIAHEDFSEHHPVNINALPKKVNIAGIPYRIQYVENASQVDIFKRQSLWGQLDPWTKTIRIFANENPIQQIYKVLFHEIIHGYGIELDIEGLKYSSDDKEEIAAVETNVDSLARLLLDFFDRNEWADKINAELQKQ